MSMSIMPYRNEEHAIEIANASRYGLSGGIFSADIERAKRVAARVRAGMIQFNGAFFDFDVPFGGCKQSGNVREWGRYGVDDFMKIKAIVGFDPLRAMYL